MGNELLEVENTLGEISFKNDKIDAVLSILYDSLDEVIKINNNDPSGTLTHYEVERVAERDSMLLHMIIELVKGSKELNSTAAKRIGKIRKELV